MKDLMEEISKSTRKCYQCNTRNVNTDVGLCFNCLRRNRINERTITALSQCRKCNRQLTNVPSDGLCDDCYFKVHTIN